MLPYVELRVIRLGPVEVPVFASLVLLALATGYLRSVRRARRQGVSLQLAGRFAAWVIAGGFAGAILLKLAYNPDLLHVQPLVALRRMVGIASFGGLFGGLLASIAWLLIHRTPRAEILRVLDVMAYVCPLSWALGRLGCTLVHDHPGIRSESWIAVRYPDWPRYDLGLLGMLFLLALSGLFAYLDRKPRPPGFFLGLGCTLTGLFRFWLDTLHVDAPRYLGWSVDQWSAALMFCLGLTIVMFSTKMSLVRMEDPA